MKIQDVPQDDIEAYKGQTKLYYAVDEQGHYHGVKSTGWNVERFATEAAVNELNQQAELALQAAKNEEVSPLAYHMARLRFDLVTMSQSTGLFQWQIKRHLKPKVFKNLSERVLNRYTDVMKISVKELKSLPIDNSQTE